MLPLGPFHAQQPYATTAVVFDGTNDHLNRGAELTGNVDGKKGIVSLWIKLNGGDGVLQKIWSNFDNTQELFRVSREASNIFRIEGQAATALQFNSTGTYLAGGGWKHLLASWDLTVPTGHLYVNDVSDLAGGATLVNLTIDYTLGQFSFGAQPAGGQRINADVAEAYLNLAEYLDFSVAQNRARFINAGKPVDLGSTGSLPTGTAPIVYFRGPASAVNTNLGTGGNFTVTGALTDAATSPSD